MSHLRILVVPADSMFGKFKRVAHYMTKADAMAAIADTTIQNDSAAVAQRIATAETINASVTAQITPEQNEKTVNEIYLASLAQGRYEFTTAELSALQSIATQCPYTGGFAVYSARNLVRLAYPFISFDNSALCNSYSERKARNNDAVNKGSTDMKFKVYPNPTTGVLTVESPSGLDSEAFIRFENTMGIPVKMQKINFRDRSSQFDVSELAPALYSYRIFVNNELNTIGKIALIK